jgi:hypothetical protein
MRATDSENVPMALTTTDERTVDRGPNHNITIRH